MTQNIQVGPKYVNPNATPVAIPEHIGEPSLIKHVFLIIKENRTYDQLFGDVTTANGIASALASLEHSPVHVVVLDMEMPNPEGDAGDAGLVFLRELAKRPSKPYVIVFTPGGSAHNAQVARELGAVSFFTKAREVMVAEIEKLQAAPAERHRARSLRRAGAAAGRRPRPPLRG